MAFDKDILRQINTRFNARRAAAEDKAEQRKQQIYLEIPRIMEIDLELRTTPVEIARAALAKHEDATPRLEQVKKKNLELQAERVELLVANGYPADYLNVHCNCEKCEDTGIVNRTERCECFLREYRIAQIARLQKSFGFDVKPFESFNLEYYSKERNGNPISPYESMEVNYALCKRYAEKFGKNRDSLFITGETGLGKTHLASCIALEVAAKGFSVMYGTAFEILGAFEDRKFNKDVQEDRTEDYKKADLLIIDDLGTEMITQFSTAALYNLMTIRENAGRSTIIISTLSATEIGEKYTPQIASRIDGNYHIVSLIGEDIRKKTGK